MPVFTGAAALAGSVFAGATFGSVATNLIAGVAFNALAMGLAGDQRSGPPPSIKKDAERGVVSRSFIVGRTSTPGSFFFEQTSGLGDPEDKKYYVAGHVLSDIPIRGLVELWVDDRLCAVDWSTYEPLRGYRIVPPGGPDDDFDAWVTFHNGTQTSADPVLLAAAAPGYEWHETDILTGCAYTSVVFKSNPEVFPSFPRVLYVVDGVRLHDAETGRTGTGDDLVAVQCDALLSGIRYDGELFYGPQVPGRLENAADQVAICRRPVPGAENWRDALKRQAFGSTQVPAQFRSGMEIPVSMPIADAMQEIMAAGNAKIAFTGAGYRLQCGEPGAPVMSISASAGDIVLTREQGFAPFLPLAETVNSVIGIGPEPSKRWNDREVKPLIVPAYERDDGDRRLTKTIQLRTVSSAEQVQRLMKAALAEARRAARVTITVTPRFFALQPLDVVTLEDQNTGSDNKRYRVDGVSDEPNGNITLDLTEVDPSDYSYEPGDFTPVDTTPIQPQPLGQHYLLGFSAGPYVIRDNSSVPRRPAIRMSWLRDQSGRQIVYHVVDAETGDEVAKTPAALQDGETVVAGGIVPGQAYRVRGRKLLGRGRTPWSDWIDVVAPDVRLGSADVDLDLGEEEIDAPLMHAPTTRLAADGTARVTFSWSQIGNAVNYDLLVSEDGGGEVSLPTTKRTHEIKATAGLEYTGRVRAQGRLGTPSVYSETVSIIAAADDEPPPVPTGLNATSGFEVIWLTWSRVSAPDLAFYEVVEKAGSSPPARNTTATVYRSLSTSFARTGVEAGRTWYYWVRAVDTSGNRSDWSAVGTSGQAINIDFEQLTGQVTGAQLVGRNLITKTAQIGDALITDGKMVSMSAAKLLTGTALTASLTVNGTALSTIDGRASDPAARINARNTQIDPGKIVISGSTTLSDWRMGGDETRIDGGRMGVNSIAANSIEIGSRNVALNGIEFEHNSPSVNRVSWTPGSIRYVNDAGNAATVAIGANDVGWTGGVLYIYWVKDHSILRATTNPGSAFGSDRMVLATYQGGRNLDANYGRVVIDGNGGIKARSITGLQLAETEALIANSAQIGTLVVDTFHAKDNSMSNFDSATRGAVRDMSGNWRTLGRITLPTNGHRSDVLGQMMAVMTYPANASVNNNAEFQVLVGGTVVVRLRDAAMNALGDTSYVHHIITRKGITFSNLNIEMRMRNCDIRSAAFWAMARKK